MIRLLTFTNLYPCDERPRHGIFVEQRLRRLVESGRVAASAVVPVPRPPWGRAGAGGSVERHGIPVSYVTFPAVRGVTSWFNPMLMAHAARPVVAGHARRFGPFDVIDAHYFYPDGVAATRLAAWFKRPLVITARGSDINVAAHEFVGGLAIRRAAKRSAALIAVSRALRAEMIAQGLSPDAITVLPNGVDLDLFRPLERAAARAALGWSGPVVLSVGNLVEEKGHDLAIEALARIPGARLVVVGSGPLGDSLRQLSVARGIADRVTWIAPVPQEELGRYYSAADICLLTSRREGMPNVLLESLACGTPVVATAVGGTPEIVTTPTAGRLVAGREPAMIAEACVSLLEAPPDRTTVRRHAENFGWQATVGRQIELLESVAAAGWP